MANPKYSNHFAVVVLVMFLVLTSQPSSSSARFLNLALPSDPVIVPEKEKEEPAIGHVSSAPPCEHHHHMGVAGKLPLPGTRLAGGKYGPLILNMFPKGSVPPSAPSKGSNSINN